MVQKHILYHSQLLALRAAYKGLLMDGQVYGKSMQWVQESDSMWKTCLIEVTAQSLPDTPNRGLVVRDELTRRVSPPSLLHRHQTLRLRTPCESDRKISPNLAQWEAATPSNQSSELSAGRRETGSQSLHYHPVGDNEEMKSCGPSFLYLWGSKYTPYHTLPYRLPQN